MIVSPKVTSHFLIQRSRAIRVDELGWLRFAKSQSIVDGHLWMSFFFDMISLTSSCAPLFGFGFAEIRMCIVTRSYDR
jgi:hypothetical protein